MGENNCFFAKKTYALLRRQRAGPRQPNEMYDVFFSSMEVIRRQMAGRSQELEAEAAKQKKHLYSRFRNTCKLLKAKRLDTLVTAKTWYANKRCKDRLCRQKKLLDTQAM